MLDLTNDYLNSQLVKLDRLDRQVMAVRLSTIRMTAFCEFPIDDAKRLQVIDQLTQDNIMLSATDQWNEVIDRVIEEVRDADQT